MRARAVILAADSLAVRTRPLALDESSEHARARHAREVLPISLDAIFTGGALLAPTHGARGAPGRGERRAHAAVSDAAGRRFGRCQVHTHRHT